MEPTEATFTLKEAMYVLNLRPQTVKDEIPFFEGKKARKFVSFCLKSGSGTNRESTFRPRKKRSRRVAWAGA